MGRIYGTLNSRGWTILFQWLINKTRKFKEEIDFYSNKISST